MVTDLTCERCAAPFEARIATKRFCSERCRKRAEEARRNARRPAEPRQARASLPQGVCRTCGTTEDMYWWQSKPGYVNPDGSPSTPTKYCRPCYNELMRARYWTRRGLPVPPKRVKADEVAPARPAWMTTERSCPVCENRFFPIQTTQKYCGKGCNQKAWMIRKGWEPRPPRPPKAQPEPRTSSPLTFRQCKHCGSWMVARNNRKMCSDACRLADISKRLMGLYRASTEVRDIPRAMHWHRRLCAYLASRDGANCGICGRPVDLTLKSGSRGSDDGPSVDHIHPRSKGGSDDLSNLRLTHWGCNRNRGNRGDAEQLRLVG